MDTIKQEIATLEGRLIKGWSIIDQRITEGSPEVKRLEDRWIGLLGELEVLCDQLMENQ